MRLRRPFLVLLGFSPRGSFATARHSDSRYVGPPILPSCRFASCPTKAWGCSSAARYGQCLTTVTARDFQWKDWAQRRLCGAMPLAANPSWAVSFVRPRWMERARLIDPSEGHPESCLLRSSVLSVMVSCGSRHGSCEVKSPPVVVYINTYILNLFLPAMASTLCLSSASPDYSCRLATSKIFT